MNILHILICIAIISVIGLFVNIFNATAGLILVYGAASINILIGTFIIIYKKYTHNIEK